MSRLRTLVIFSVCATLAIANSAFCATAGVGDEVFVTCNAGYYLTDSGECEICPAGTYSNAGATECTPCPAGTYSDTPGATACTTVTKKYYATGCDDDGTKCTGEAKCKNAHYCTGGVMFPCPDPETHKRTTFPDYYVNAVIDSISNHSAGTSAGNVSECMAVSRISTDRGNVSDYAQYNPNTEQYDKTSLSLWSSVSPGYYLTNAGTCGALAYYRDLIECPAGSYCPGRTAVSCNAETQAQVQTKTFGLETCPAGTYSVAGAAECTPCPNGKYSPSGAGECISLCPAGTYNADASSACAPCPGGTWSDAGATTCNACPDPNTHTRTWFPDYYYTNPVVILRARLVGTAGDITRCDAITYLESDRGVVLDYAFYNPETEQYDITHNHLWRSVKPGYYLATPRACGSYAYYDDALECRSGSYCPGKGEVVCNAQNKDEVHTPTFGLETCPNGTWSDRGAATCNACPDLETHQRTTFPDYYYENPVILGGYVDGTAGSILRCQAIVTIGTSRGQVIDYAYYNPETEQYDKTNLHLWRSVNPGYYLTTPGSCGRYAYYRDALECPAGAYCPGKGNVVCNAENQAQVHTPTFGLETCSDNSYSDIGAAACTPCVHGTGNFGDLTSDHANVSSCLGLCAAGYTKLNIGTRKFNLWPTDKCTSPSLRASVNDSVCCVHLAPGHGPGINVELHNKVYHTTN